SGTVRQRLPSRSTSTRPGPTRRSAVILGGCDLVRGLFGRLGLGVCLHGLGRIVAQGQEPRGNDRVGSDLRLERTEDLLSDVWMLAQEGGRVLPPLPEPLVAVAEIRARFLHELLLQADLEHRPFPGDPFPVDDVELRLLEWR